MRALDTLRDLIAMANREGEEGRCPCTAFPNLDIPGMGEALTQLLAEAAGALDILTMTGDLGAAERHAGHVLTIAVALGYALGAESAYDVVLSSDITVPESLAALDILGDD
jgi:hypothetical protein